MTVNPSLGRAAACAAPIFCCSSLSFAADMPAPVVKAPPPEPPVWTYTVMPYAWLPSLDGSTTVKGRTADIDATFVDLLHRKIPKELFGLMGAFEARKGPFAVMTDRVYMKVGVSDSGARARSVHPQVGGTLAASASLQFKMFIAEAALAYEVLQWGGAATGSQTSIDLYGGGRFWWQNADASLALTAGMNVADLTISGARALASSGDVTWFDPLLTAYQSYRTAVNQDEISKAAPSAKLPEALVFFSESVSAVIIILAERHDSTDDQVQGGAAAVAKYVMAIPKVKIAVEEPIMYNGSRLSNVGWAKNVAKKPQSQALFDFEASAQGSIPRQIYMKQVGGMVISTSRYAAENMPRNPQRYHNPDINKTMTEKLIANPTCAESTMCSSETNTLAEKSSLHFWKEARRQEAFAERIAFRSKRFTPIIARQPPKSSLHVESGIPGRAGP